MYGDGSIVQRNQTTQLQQLMCNNHVEKHDLSKLPDFIFLKKRDLTEVNINKCSICLDDYKIREQYIVIDCKHAFHKKCLYKWFLRYNRTCPICRLNPFENNNLNS